MPTNGVANMMEGWQFTAEFVAALTRRGKMPTMWQSISVPGARDRDDKLAKVKFETYKRHPIPEGRLSADYADQLRGHLSKVFHSERNGIDALGRMMAQTITSGASIYYLSDGHADPHALGQENTPKIGIVEGNINPTHVHPQSGDVVLFLGYNARFGHPEWQRIATDAEGVGAKVVYSFAGYDKSEVSAIPSTVLYIDQHWVLGDAEVKIKDYDVNVFPVSGVIEDTILYMALADVIGLQVTNAAPLSAR